MISAFDRWRDRLGLALLGAMVSAPFLHPWHFNPIPSFWAEWWAVALGLAAAGVLLTRSAAWQPMRLPRVMLVPLILCVAAVIQVALRQVTFVEQALLYAAMLLWAALMMMLGRHARERFGLERLADLLAGAILGAALINATIALLQWQNATAFAYPWIFPRIGGHTPYGNLGQGNHLNHQMWLGIVSATYLHLRGRVAMGWLWAAVVPLLFGASLTASRSIFLYAAFVPLLAVALARFDPTRDAAKHWLKATWPLLPAVGMLQWLTRNLPEFGVYPSVGSASERLFQEISGTDIRLRLIVSAWRDFLEAPWLGNGIGAFPWKLFLANDQAGADWAPGVAEHAHNIVLQCLHDFGLVPTAIAAIGLLWWLRQFLAARWELPQVWIAGILGIAAIHSLLEYPLWYGFFLGLAALLFGMSDDRGFDLHNGWRGATLAGLVVAGAVAPLAALRADYVVLEQVINRRPSEATWRHDIDSLLQVQRNSLLAPHVLVALAVTMEPDTDRLDAKVGVCGTAQRFAPSQHIVFKCAVLLQLAGEDDAAALQMRRALRAFPDARPLVVAELERMASREPRLAPLAALAAAAN